MTQYGSETILPYNKEEQKGTQVKRMFDSIAETYDQLNHTLSFGIDKIWRRKGIAFLRPFSPKTILDRATGLYGLDLRGKLVRCRNRRFRGS